ncbi:MAG: hypothetical protein ACRD44_18595, partial [Bryobacteraceae bacterium]
MTDRFRTGAVILLLTLLGFWHFPGHTFLHSDTQIYIPILERLRDPSVLGSDLVATRPHVSYSVYDELTLLLARVGLSFQAALIAQQLVLRALGIFGIFLIAAALGLPARMALLVAGLFALGANIGGPSVLTVEYEPVPRGFALPLTLLAAGLAAHGRFRAGGVAAGIALLYHPPTT